jgi:hypothetical protein
MQRTKGALVSTAVNHWYRKGVLDIWWDIEIALPNGWYDTERREYRQVSSRVVSVASMPFCFLAQMSGSEDRR